MYNLLIALGAGVLGSLAFMLFGFGWAASILPGLIVLSVVFVLASRRTGAEILKINEEAQAVMQVQQVRTEKERDAIVDKAIAVLERGLVYDKWQFLVGSELRANIGMLLYLKKDMPRALPMLAQASERNWMAKVMEGCIAFQSKDLAATKSAFEKAVSTAAGKKEALAWGAFAWCLWKLDADDDARRVLGRAVTENPKDEKLVKCQQALQNGKKLSMQEFTPMWWQLGLEKPPPIQIPQQQQPQMRFGRRGRRW